jgi:hypothetical protein
MPYLTLVLFTTLWLAQQRPTWAVLLVIAGIVMMLIGIAGAASASGGGGGGGGSGSSSSISRYTSSIDETRSSARSSMRAASDDHLKNVHDTLRR